MQAKKVGGGSAAAAKGGARSVKKTSKTAIKKAQILTEIQDYKIAIKAYTSYLEEGKKSTSIDDLIKEAGLERDLM
jgi:hypothetical protein